MGSHAPGLKGLWKVSRCEEGWKCMIRINWLLLLTLLLLRLLFCRLALWSSESFGNQSWLSDARRYSMNFYALLGNDTIDEMLTRRKMVWAGS